METAPASVLIIESHPLLREALCTTISDEPDLQVVAEAATTMEALQIMETIHPDIILLALGNPGGDELNALITMRKSRPNTCILALTSNEVDGQEQAALDAGANIALTKTVPRKDLILALRELQTPEVKNL